jgi:hypothetical protein
VAPHIYEIAHKLHNNTLDASMTRMTSIVTLHLNALNKLLLSSDWLPTAPMEITATIYENTMIMCNS